ncbi:MAG: PQQ-binding-like beta-propeller repeat protein [Acidaminococcaceae bacterium]
MKKIKGKIALLLLFLSWLALLWITGERTPWQMFNTREQGESVSVYLGDIPVQNYDRMGFTKGIVRSVARNNSWLVGTDKGELVAFDRGGRQLWRRSLGIGKLTSMGVSKDEKIVFVGEQSPTGQIFAVNITNGDLLWKLATDQFVGAEPAQRSYPSVAHMSVDAADNVFFTAYRFSMDQKGNRTNVGKVCAVDKKGTLLWQFPPNEPMDTYAVWCDVSDKAGSVVVSTSTYEITPEMKYRDTLYFLNKTTGTLLHSEFLAAIVPFKTVVMRGSPQFSATGEYLAGCTSDGRGFLFNREGKLLWTRIISSAQKVGDAWINAGGRDAFVLPTGVLFSTVNTFNRENWQLPTPVEHPGNNSLFMFNVEGDFKYRHKAAGTIEEIAFAQDLVACAVGRNVRTHNYQAAHGLTLLRLIDGECLQHFTTAGPLQAVALSQDGNFAGGIEAPALTPEGKILGSYSFHIWDLSKIAH